MEYKIAFVASIFNETDIIKKQLKEKGITNIDVYPFGSNPEGYDIVKYNVRPNKKHGVIVDFSRNIERLGFQEDKFESVVYDENNVEGSYNNLKKEFEKKKLKYLPYIIDNDIEEISREIYEDKLYKIRNDNRRLSTMTIEELYKKMQVEEDEPTEVILITAVIMDKLYCKDKIDNYGKRIRYYIANNDKEVKNFLNGNSINWISEKWVEVFESIDDEKKRKYINALKTRCINIIKNKETIWKIRFFIDFLLEQDEHEDKLKEAIRKADEDDDFNFSTGNNNISDDVLADEDYGDFEYSDDMDDIPF